MPRRLYLAPFGAHDATGHLLEEALALVPGPDYRGILYLAPSPRKLRDTEYRFARLCGRAGFIPPAFLTPGQLARRLFEADGRARPLPAELRPLLVNRLLPTSAPRATLGYAHALADFIADIKTWVTPADRPRLRALFAETLVGFERPLARALEALDVLERYDAELAARGRVDDEDILAAAPGPAARRPPRVLILDGFAAPDPPEAALLAALVAASETTLVSCFAGDDADPDYAFAGRFRAFIEDLGGFVPARLEAGPLPDPDGLYAFPDPEQEIAGIARHLRAREDLADTVVALPDLSARAPLVRRVFRQYGLAATLYPETRLDASPPVVAVLDLLAALAHDFERLPTASALSSPWLPGLLRLPADEDDAGRDRAAAALNGVSRRAGIIKGRDNWRHIAARLAGTGRRLADAEAALAADLQARVRRALGLADKMLEPADTIGHQAARLKAFLEAVGFGGRFAPGTPGLAALLEDRGALYDVLDELVAFEADFGARDEPRAEFIRTLGHLVGLCGRTADSPPAGVLVVGLAETVGLHPAHVVVGGLTETSLPGAYSPDPVLPDRLRKRLGMPDLDWHRDKQRFHLRRTIESGRDAAFLCFHDGSEGNPVLPTPLLTIPPRRPPESAASCAAIEDQVAAGAGRAMLFDEQARAVDFSADRRVRAALRRRFGPDRAIRVTDFEAYRACPFRFYLERVLGLETPAEPQYEIDARQWGTVIHDALNRLYAGGPVPVARLADRARAAFDRTLRESGLPAFWAETARRVFDNLLPAYVAIEQGLRDEGWQPEQVERTLEGKVADDLIVRGRLDRVDAGPAGRLVLDYKSGRAGISARDVLEHRTHLQLPLYARLLEQESGRPVANAGIYSLREGRIRWLADEEHPVTELVAAALATAAEVAAAIRAGRFPAEPARGACDNCDHAYLCGPARAGDE
jgi:RecB family exonuclease